MSISTDEDEHSIEMHLPYVRHVFRECVPPVALKGFYADESTIAMIPRSYQFSLGRSTPRKS